MRRLIKMQIMFGVITLILMALFIIFVVNPRRAKADECLPPVTLNSVEKKLNVATSFQYKEGIAFVFNGIRYAQEKDKESISDTMIMRIRIMSFNDPFSIAEDATKTMKIYHRQGLDYKDYAIDFFTTLPGKTIIRKVEKKKIVDRES